MRGLLVLLLLCASVEAVRRISKKAPSFVVDKKKKQFLLDGEPFRYLSGSIHYFRVIPSQWSDRLYKVRAMGLNAVEYYVPWNMHEVTEGRFDFSDGLDIGQFAQTAHEHQLWSIIRIGPYICGEWENGGLPWWILNKNITKQRTSDPVFLAAVESWFGQLLPRLVPLLRQNGGPVIMLQIENEYGNYACDRAYNEWLRDLVRRYVGDDAVLFTTDNSANLKCGAIDGVLTTVDFYPTTNKTEIQEYFDAQRAFDPTAPRVVSEYYPGWFTLWGAKKQYLPDIDVMIKGAQIIYDLGSSLNFYMIFGGTNFGFWNGAESEAPLVTSYDYRAPISEAGDVTRGFLEIRKWIKSLPDWPQKPLDVPSNSPKGDYGKFELKRAELFAENENSKCYQSDSPLSFEKIHHPFGFVVYSAKTKSCGDLFIDLFADFAYVFVNKQFEGRLVRQFYNESSHSLKLPHCAENQWNELRIVVENQGRQTYLTINDRKGILSDVQVGGKIVRGWTQCGVHLPNYGQQGTVFKKKPLKGTNQTVGVYVGEVGIKGEPRDTWLYLPNWGKGVAIVNGHNLGRFWSSVGPQMTLYTPAEWLRQGPNLVMLIELEGVTVPDASFINHPVFEFKTAN